MSKRIDMTNQKIGKLLVLEYVESDRAGRMIWKCKCDCGNFHKVSGKYLRQKHTTSCGECDKTFIVPLWWYNDCKVQAKRRNIKFNLTRLELNNLLIKQNSRCKLSNQYISIPQYKKSILCTASLDRINSDKDYTIDNIQWVHKDVNFMKMNLNQDIFIYTCKLIAENNK